MKTRGFYVPPSEDIDNPEDLNPRNITIMNRLREREKSLLKRTDTSNTGKRYSNGESSSTKRTKTKPNSTSISIQSPNTFDSISPEFRTDSSNSSSSSSGRSSELSKRLSNNSNEVNNTFHQSPRFSIGYSSASTQKSNIKRRK